MILRDGTRRKFRKLERGVAQRWRHPYVPIMRRPPTWRAFALFWAVLQFALPMVALHADLRLERESQQATGAHVESGTTTACRPVHPDNCALCQVLTRNGAPTQAATLPCIASVVRPSPALTIARLTTLAAAAAELPRAPPALG